jgi:putative hydrolases of HD superfamily
MQMPNNDENNAGSPDAKNERMADFFFEVGTMRRIQRMHRQTLLVEDSSDTIASHSYRVTLIGWHLAKLAGADPYKVVMMCLTHDLGEIRSNDHNWVHKRYVKIFENEILKEQLGTLPFDDLYQVSQEYEERTSLESQLAKDADIIDQILLLREYEWQGSKEAAIWLKGNRHANDVSPINRLVTPEAQALGKILYEHMPTKWSQELTTGTNR